MTRRRGGGRDPLWEAGAREFLAEKRRAGASVATLSVYGADLLGRRITAWRQEHGVERVSQMTTERLRDYELVLADARPALSPATRHQHHRVLHTFLAFAREEGWTVDDGTLRVRGPKLPQRQPPVLSEGEEKRLLAAARCERDRYLIEFMVRTGLRLSGVCSVTLDDLLEAPEGTMLRVIEKGDKERIIPLDTRTYRGTRRLRRYIADVRPRDTRRRELFLTLRKEDGDDYRPMTPRAVQTVIKRLGVATGIRVHPHLFRHTFASRAIAAGVDPLTLQRVLGHTTLTMVSRYVHYDTAGLARIWHRRGD